MTMDPGIIARDRRQGFFAQSFSAFSSKLISKNRLQSGAAQLKKHAALLAKVEEKYGVQGPVIVAFWALESDFGAGMGNLPVLRSLATLAYDCRRPEMFRDEFMDALRIIDRGDLRPEEMIGSWAGELGQTQFLPSHYLKHAVDFDGDGRRNLMSSPADVVGSTGAFMQHLGWQKGQPWLQEVRVTKPLPWDQADLAIQHPRSKWAGWGVTQINGQPLPSDAVPASLVLPMGRFGPAFLAYENFQVYLKWNQSLNYALTAAHLAARLAGAPAYAAPTAQIHDWSQEQMKELQQQLGPARLQRRRDRRQDGRRHARRRQGGADQVRAPGQLLPHARAAGAPARGAVRRSGVSSTRVEPCSIRAASRISPRSR